MLLYVGLGTLGFAILTAFFYWQGVRGRRPVVDIFAASRRFSEFQVELQTTFLHIARSTGKPRGLRWTHCDWSDSIAFARDRQTGQLLALAGVTISFEAIEGGDMEGVEAVGNLRNASAVFFFDGDWRTVGRVVFNLNPDEAIEHFKATYERVFDEQVP